MSDFTLARTDGEVVLPFNQFVEMYEERLKTRKRAAEWKRTVAQRSRNEARLSRTDVLRRCKGHCELCNDFQPWTLEAHHIVSVANGGHGEQSNLIALCPNCHAVLEKLTTIAVDDPRFHDWLHDRYGENGYNKLEELLAQC